MFWPKLKSSRPFEIGLVTLAFLGVVAGCGSHPLGVGAGTAGAGNATGNLGDGSGGTGGLGNISTSPSPSPGVTTGPWLNGGSIAGNLTQDTNAQTLVGNPSGTFTSRVLDANASTTWQSLTALSDRPLNIPFPDGRGADPANFAAGRFDMSALGNLSLLHLSQMAADGTITDASGLNHGGVCTNCQLSTGTNLFGKPYLSFNGSTSYLKLGAGTGQSGLNIDGTMPFSIALWFRTTNGADGTLFAQRGSDYDGAVVVAINHPCPNGSNADATGQVNFWVWGGGNHEEVRTAVPGGVADGNWHQLVAVRDNGTMTLYFDGVQNAQATNQSNVNANGNLTDCIGRDCYGGNRYLTGDVQEVAVFSTALMAGQVADAYIRARPGIGFQIRYGDNPGAFSDPNAGWTGPTAGNSVFYPSAAGTGAGPTPLLVNGNPVTGRYFQFRAVMAAGPLGLPAANQIIPKLLGFSLNPNPF